jgi:hypothetical protein
VRDTTGYAIGGVCPVGHVVKPVMLIDRDLFNYDSVWAAAGHPHAVFNLTAAQLEDDRRHGGRCATGCRASAAELFDSHPRIPTTPTETRMMSLPKKVKIVEVGPRRFAEREGNHFRRSRSSWSTGFRRRVSQMWGGFLRLAQVGAADGDLGEVMHGITRKPGVVYSALVPNMKGFEAALEAGWMRW